MGPRTQLIEQRLFNNSGLNVFAVLDGASIPNLLAELRSKSPPLRCECLYRGALPPDMAEVAPYLVQLEPNAGFTNWLIDVGWGNHWGIFALSELDFQSIRYHFRALTRVYNETGKRFLYFRYYDPRVLRIFLPTCLAPQLIDMFGPVDYFLSEGESPSELLGFMRESGDLVTTRATLPQAG